MEAILETKAETILQFIGGLRGSLYVAFEEGTGLPGCTICSKPHVARVLASDPRNCRTQRRSLVALFHGKPPKLTIQRQ